MMKFFISVLTAMVLVCGVHAHELTPTYPEIKPAYISGVSKVSVTIFNRRPEVAYYEIGVFDADWNKIEFASTYKILEVKYLQKKIIDVYIRANDKPTYVCTTSKLPKENVTATVVISKVCSKIK